MYSYRQCKCSRFYLINYYNIFTDLLLIKLSISCCFLISKTEKDPRFSKTKNLIRSNTSDTYLKHCLTSGLRRKTVRNPKQRSKAKRESLPINCNEKEYIIIIKTDKGVSYKLETSVQTVIEI